ncbi:hypothetical protein BJ980_000216 [Nocardioides daedukensis]|uniref:SnoaL-like domain-containing protein n=1 Tax=Nocardioides daedukensis TaxID=634462 RepID=A0A7Y9RZC8_9ACTN|nr:hypothetical protein [Nocardioides daedukensis]NYG57293.1 hypothetical protein [Nocardioides daedukensis]
MKSRLLIIVLAVVLVVLAVSTGLFSRMRGTESAVAATGTVAGVVAAAPVVRQQQPGAPRRVLAGWDERRAAAWAIGSVTDLRALYVEGSAAGRVDVRMLKAWLRKGVRVEGMQTQVLDFTVVSHTSDELVLDVTDRLSGGVAVGAGDEIALPVDRADRRRIALVRRQGEWLVSSVR